MNPYFGDFDTYHMAASAIDEAMRNAVAVGADPSNVAILDNFCWGYTDRPETLGSLVRAAIACQDLAVALGTPFISGKDSLNNEFSYFDESGDKKSISIPPSLLISAMGQIEDVSLAVTMDLKRPGNAIYLIGETREELGGSHFSLVRGLSGGQVPTVDPARAKKTFATVHEAMKQRLIRSCHDLSEGGLAVALAEMSFAGRLGVKVDLAGVNESASTAAVLFGESNTRFLVEITPSNEAAIIELFKTAGVALRRLGEVVENDRVVIKMGDQTFVDEPLTDLLHCWQKPLNW
jgi:phosphoribosylformylglycinamidine synthase